MIGIDADATWLATDNITLGAHISYTHSEYTSDFEVIDPNDPHQPQSLFDANSNLINLNGNQMIRIPEWKGGAWGMYSWPLGDMGKLEFLANWSYIDQVYFSVFEREDQSAPSYQRVDFRATWRSNDEQWMVAAFVNNVLDEIGLRQIEQYGATEAVNFRRSGAPSDPRLYGMEVRYKFGAAR
jgi:iron complex outermembrane receptor protein